METRRQLLHIAVGSGALTLALSLLALQPPIAHAETRPSITDNESYVVVKELGYDPELLLGAADMVWSEDATLDSCSERGEPGRRRSPWT